MWQIAVLISFVLACMAAAAAASCLVGAGSAGRYCVHAASDCSWLQGSNHMMPSAIILPSNRTFTHWHNLPHPHQLPPDA